MKHFLIPSMKFVGDCIFEVTTIGGIFSFFSGLFCVWRLFFGAWLSLELSESYSELVSEGSGAVKGVLVPSYDWRFGEFFFFFPCWPEEDGFFLFLGKPVTFRFLFLFLPILGV